MSLIENRIKDFNKLVKVKKVKNKEKKKGKKTKVELPTEDLYELSK